MTARSGLIVRVHVLDQSAILLTQLGDVTQSWTSSGSSKRIYLIGERGSTLHSSAAALTGMTLETATLQQAASQVGSTRG